MITPEEFKQRWLQDEYEKLVQFNRADIEGLAISDDAKQFLMEAGLPESAAPCLSFGQSCYGPLDRVSEAYDLPSEYSRYRIIGSDGSGDPVCIDESDSGCIVSLNHDNRFERIFMNSSVFRMAESLLVYREMISETLRINGDDAFLDGDIPEDVLNRATHKLIEIDDRSMVEGAFWNYAFVF